ncbi:uncharacterized protein LOC127291699 [Leptopilina boulardi]|uniref:uncharacterized protein LOC127281606 n=1 Tax=Leptopilina boulardi TaxID=63433 RepID=UPI0021F69061|nr:uncharacterized protein LOC127281606 [Leptopilina boulardi]XP_051163462.1 uncharacterized protein LOC127282918 [Leptopilina boulardi]XP_051164752.1 uncharacterized protein LOC127283736 [Leptopilina boulardi]XP_051174083.1 uncharacterized protein LOC127289885 isoform X1 [Leptopilina boulardi]XP_051176895.1 uncharacterized protein LOC127291699 [Leptopilina boulardi]
MESLREESAEEGVPSGGLERPGHSVNEIPNPAVMSCVMDADIDLLTGNNIQSAENDTNSFLPSPIRPSINPKKRNISVRNNNESVATGSSDGSFGHITKKLLIPEKNSYREIRADRQPHSADIGPENASNQSQFEDVIWDQHDLEWNNSILPPLYSASSPPPFIVLMESTIRGKNIGKLDPICVIDLISPIIEGGKQITRNGKNQIKIDCAKWQDANTLVGAKELILAGYVLFIPDSFLRKKGFTRWFPTNRSVRDIVRVCREGDLDNIASIRRIIDDRNTILEKIEFTFNSPIVPRNIVLGDFVIPITPSLQRPRRCFRCQRYCHVANQCRSTYPTCEFCSGRHLTDLCPNGHLQPKCKNCKGSHVASSSECPVFKFEFGILKYRYIHNCNREEAKLLFYAENPDLLNNIETRGETPLPLPVIRQGMTSTQPTRSSTPIDLQDKVNNPIPDPVLEISNALNQHQLSEKISAVNTLININQSRSNLINSINENLSTK